MSFTLFGVAVGAYVATMIVLLDKKPLPETALVFAVLCSGSLIAGAICHRPKRGRK